MAEKRAGYGLYAALAASIVIFLAISYVLFLNFFPKADGPAAEDGNRLKIPAVLHDYDPSPESALFEIVVEKGKTSFIDGKEADTLGYNGTYLGPVIRLRRGEKVEMNVANELPEATTVHWHGLIVDGEDDGGPHHGIQPGERWAPVFTVDQSAATLWYHPHLMGNTSDQVYFGLAGLIYIDDEVSDSLGLPDEYGVDDIPLIVQDRSFNSDGTLAYRVNMMGVIPGDTLLVNGGIGPFYEVTAERLRMRILNGSNSENFTFALSDGSSFHMIASDGGLLEEPYETDEVMLAPGERAEIVADFKGKGGKTLQLVTGNSNVLELRIGSDLKKNGAVPERLAEVGEPEAQTGLNVRHFELQSMGISGTINGKSFDMDRIDEELRLNESEVWVIRNPVGMMQSGGHPFHVHGVQFRILSRNGREPGPEESGYKDTVFVNAGEEVRILIRFRKIGVFMYHCHILEHEDNGMMGQILVE
ncbi:multicopper oxidase family protein [Youngiibacter multivorans]|uniref:FtsP/CotA-like multicopper oxidase with cupredoxin domain n=1 Tax=Youngiibacter multivorans TaxID=937251 RepID=A0ABS4G3Q7_9CLOT|nr:multicopper oxidase domain-containing protein [Youngiibacter multivorans]MBP1919166.1 FtsP/CotA-like multicopper oxidase with cupredoxin domain [Youngiibacter multivorans]